jgi:hypothetical protein
MSYRAPAGRRVRCGSSERSNAIGRGRTNRLRHEHGSQLEAWSRVPTPKALGVIVLDAASYWPGMVSALAFLFPGTDRPLAPWTCGSC